MELMVLSPQENPGTSPSGHHRAENVYVGFREELSKMPPSPFVLITVLPSQTEQVGLFRKGDLHRAFEGTFFFLFVPVQEGLVVFGSIR